MRRVKIIILIQLLSTAVFCQDTLFTYYNKLNQAEQRLLDYKDSDENLNIKIAQLKLINKSRKKYKAQEVSLDILACRVANKMAKEAAENKYLSHWNLAGEKPYNRYYNAGGLDHVAENAYMYWNSENLKRDSLSKITLLKEGHKSFMSEKAPNDGHKKNCIDKAHNYVGIGFHIHNGHFLYYEEFIDRYYTFENYERKTYKKDEKIEFSIICDSTIQITQVYVTKEKKLKPRKSIQLNIKGSYLDGSTKFTNIGIPKSEFINGKVRYNFSFKLSSPGTYYLKIIHKKVKKGKLKGDDINGSGILINIE